jgi:hypothetical protein
MFRKRHKLEQRLAAGELRRAQAHVLTTHFLGTSSQMAIGAEGPGHYRVRVRIEPPGEASFEASLNVNATHLHVVPHEGGELPVAYDADDHDAVIWDEPTAQTIAVARRAADRERRERLAHERRKAGLPPLEASAPDPELAARLHELQARRNRGELTDWEFRTARAEVMKDAGF